MNCFLGNSALLHPLEIFFLGKILFYNASLYYKKSEVFVFIKHNRKKL